MAPAVGSWALRLVGDFERPDSLYVLSVPSERVARRRAAWWRWWGPKVQVSLLRWGLGGWEEMSDVES